MFESMLSGLLALASIKVLLIMILGVVIGLIFGFLPGLGGTIALAVLIPFTFGMEPSLGFAFLLGAHVSVTFGGSVSAILFNVPGTSQNVATCFDGYPMSQKGEASRALGLSGMSSMLGGIAGALCLALSMPIIRPIIMAIGPAEYFMLTLFGLTVIALLTAGSLIKGITAAGLGMLFSFVGMDEVTGTPRFTFGSQSLWDGIDFVAVVIGLFAIAQMVDLYVKGGSIASRDTTSVDQSSVFTGVIDTIRNWRLVLRTGALGAFVGIIPGVGGAVANILAYGHALQTSKSPETFGKGNIEGVIGPEAANNAKEGGALIPTIAFGIPGSEAMAILLGGFLMMGLVPGPEMITKNMDVIYMLVFIIVIANILSTTLGLCAAGHLARLTTLPGAQLVPFILVICVVGAFAISGRWLDVVVALVFGAIGYIMKTLNFSRAGFIIAMVLGPFTERYFHVANRLFGPWFIFQRPIALGLLVLVIFSALYPLIKNKKNGNRGGGIQA